MTTCRFCHRALKNPRHVAAGVGPTCAKKHGLVYARKLRPRKFKEEKPRPASPFTEVPLPFEVQS